MTPPAARRSVRARGRMWAAAGAVAARPWLWPAAVVQARRLAPRGWWRRPPFLPLPDRDYLRFRLQTAYGDPDRPIEPDDLVAWLRWTRRFRVFEER
jgi:hypothetical protein